MNTSRCTALKATIIQNSLFGLLYNLFSFSLLALGLFPTIFVVAVIVVVLLYSKQKKAIFIHLFLQNMKIKHATCFDNGTLDSNIHYVLNDYNTVTEMANNHEPLEI